MDICLDTICKYGKHISPGKISDDYKNFIRKEVASGKTKKQVAEEYGASYAKAREITL